MSGSISYSRRTTLRLALMDGLVLLYMLAASFYLLLFGLKQTPATVAAILAEYVHMLYIQVTPCPHNLAEYVHRYKNDCKNDVAHLSLCCV